MKMKTIPHQVVFKRKCQYSDFFKLKEKKLYHSVNSSIQHLFALLPSNKSKSRKYQSKAVVVTECTRYVQYLLIVAWNLANECCFHQEDILRWLSLEDHCVSEEVLHLLDCFKPLHNSLQSKINSETKNQLDSGVFQTTMFHNTKRRSSAKCQIISLACDIIPVARQSKFKKTSVKTISTQTVENIEKFVEAAFTKYNDERNIKRKKLSMHFDNPSIDEWLKELFNSHNNGNSAVSDSMPNKDKVTNTSVLNSRCDEVNGSSELKPLVHSTEAFQSTVEHHGSWKSSNSDETEARIFHSDLPKVNLTVSTNLNPTIQNRKSVVSNLHQSTSKNISELNTRPPCSQTDYSDSPVSTLSAFQTDLTLSNIEIPSIQFSFKNPLTSSQSLNSCYICGSSGGFVTAENNHSHSKDCLSFIPENDESNSISLPNQGIPFSPSMFFNCNQ